MTHPASQPERPPWWKGARGEWYVVAQIALMLLVFLGPRAWAGWPPPFFRAAPGVARLAGRILALLGAILFVSGLVHLGRNATPLPHPKAGGTLVTTGTYALVRHPLYGGGIVMGFGWALIVRSWLTLGYAALLFLFLDLKSRREERWLVEKYAGYAEYRRRVRRLIPYLY